MFAQWAVCSLVHKTLLAKHQLCCALSFPILRCASDDLWREWNLVHTIPLAKPRLCWTLCDIRFRGVHQTFPTRRWEAQFRRNGKPTSLGCFDKVRSSQSMAVKEPESDLFRYAMNRSVGGPTSMGGFDKARAYQRMACHSTL